MAGAQGSTMRVSLSYRRDIASSCDHVRKHESNDIHIPCNHYKYICVAVERLGADVKKTAKCEKKILKHNDA